MSMNSLLITGGAGFIGSNFVRYILGKYPEYQAVVLDKLTYAGNRDNLRDVEANPRYTFVRGDICDGAAVERVMAEHGIDAIVNFAAESHVDRSLLEPASFLMTDVYGTYVLLEAARRFGVERFLQVSTDEVYGHIEAGAVTEDAPLSPRSPYAASKAGADMLVLAYHISHGVPTLITRGSNTFGPYHHPEKLIPLCITNAVDDQPLPIYGDGRQVRDWLYVEDHCRGIDVVLHQGQVGEVYNLGAGAERYNLEVVRAVLRLLGKSEALIRHVADRPGHDRRYSMDSAKLRALGWQPTRSFEEALAQTVRWYQENEAWWRKIKGGEFRQYYEKQYGQRLTTADSGQIE